MGVCGVVVIDWKGKLLISVSGFGSCCLVGLIGGSGRVWVLYKWGWGRLRIERGIGCWKGLWRYLWFW